MVSVLSDNMLTAARAYHHELGINVVPVRPGTKKPSVKWELFQDKRVDESRLGPWFYRSEGIAAIMGPVSGGLACRDFDVPEGYETWTREHKDLAGFLATAKTAHGWHVYFRTSLPGTIRDLGDGELRLSRCVTMLPPSLHPSGARYAWTIPPTAANLIHLDDLTRAGFINPDCESLEVETEKAECAEMAECAEEDRGDIRGGEVVMGEEVLAMIERTLPREPGTRHRRLFELIRHLKSSPQFAEVQPKTLRPIVEEWHRQALPAIRTRAFEETWIDFLNAWPKVRTLLGQNPLAKIFERALRVQPPAVALAKYPGHHELQLLAALCRELQRAAGAGTFFLSCRTAGDLLGVSRAQAGRWLWLLNDDGIIRTIQKGGTEKTARRATRYRYMEAKASR